MWSRSSRATRLFALSACVASLSVSIDGQASRQPRLPATPQNPPAPIRLAQPARPVQPARTSPLPSETPSVGERFYLRGISTSGAPVAATVQGDIKVQSSEMPCVNCHRRSAMGTAEGTLVVPSITGPVLFAAVTKGAPQLGAPRTSGDGTRPAYTDEDVLRAIRDGVDPSGRTLSATMPRYAVTAADVKAIADHLRKTGSRTPPGVDDAIVHIATIITPRVSPERRASMLDVLRTYVRAKNGGTRYETRRRTTGGWDMKQQYEAYRDWVLDEWELHGAPKEWPAQLEDLYRRQPVFAIVGGIADEDWSTIDAFCARKKLPAILPQTPMPPAIAADDGFYSMYFSKGANVEAEALAHHLSATPLPALVQVARCGSPGQIASAELARAFKPGALRSECIPAASTISSETWRPLIGSADTLVLWLDATDMPGVEALAKSDSAAKLNQVYLSSSLLGGTALHVPAELSARTMLMHPFVAPDEFDKHAARSLMWFKASGLQPADPRVAVNAFFAVTLAADALSRPHAIDSREYFVEIIEHMASRSPYPSAYPSVAFGPTRRFASSGSYLLALPSAPGEPYRKVEEWYVAK